PKKSPGRSSSPPIGQPESGSGDIIATAAPTATGGRGKYLTRAGFGAWRAGRDVQALVHVRCSPLAEVDHWPPSETSRSVGYQATAPTATVEDSRASEVDL